MSNLANQTNTLFNKWDTDHTPGCMLAVIQDGDTIYERGYGMANLETNEPISPDSVFYIASTSKQFTTACILLLSQSDKLTLDDDIRKYIPEMPTYDKPITIRHLIHHTSGLRDSLTLLNLSGIDTTTAVYSNADLIQLIVRQQELNFSPGTQHKYCNAGYLLMAEIVERISGQTFRQFAHDNIFAPLGMNNTHFDDNHTEHIPHRVVSYHSDGDSYKPYPKNFDIVGSGGLLTTVGDLALWDLNFYNPKVGDAKFLDTFCGRGSLDNGDEIFYGFGLYIGDYKGLRTIHHPGGMLGFSTDLYRFPDQQFSVVILSNLQGFDAAFHCRNVADIYLADHFQLNDYPGQYYSEELNITYTLEVTDGELFITSPDIYDKPLEAKLGNAFQTGSKNILFTRDAKQNITGFDIKTDRVFNIHFKKV